MRRFQRVTPSGVILANITARDRAQLARVMIALPRIRVSQWILFRSLRLFAVSV